MLTGLLRALEPASAETTLLPNNALLAQGDATNLISTIPDGCISAVITDPPYGREVDGWDGAIHLDPAWIDFWATQVHRVVKPTGCAIIYCQSAQLSLWERSLAPLFPKLLPGVWCKTNPNPFGQIISSIEHCIFAWNKGHTWNRASEELRALNKNMGFKYNSEKCALRNYKMLPICGPKERIMNPRTNKILHKTQKPLRLMKFDVETATRPGDVVLDPFMGVASTGHACIELGRKFIGFELNQPYYDASVRRIKGTLGPRAWGDAA